MKYAYLFGVWVAAFLFALTIYPLDSYGAPRRNRTLITHTATVKVRAGQSKPVRLPKAIRRAAKAQGGIKVTVASPTISTISVFLSDEGEATSPRRATRRQRTWVLSYSGDTTVILENSGTTAAKVKVTVNARKPPQGTPRPTKTPKQPKNPTATPTPKGDQPTATPTPIRPTATPTATPGVEGVLRPDWAGHDRTCSSYAAAAPLRRIYVQVGGNDANPGTLAAPFATLQKACGIAKAGDEINVRAGSYAGCTITASGTEANPIVIQAARTATGEYEQVTIDRKAGATYASHGVLNSEGGSWNVFRGFRVTGTDARTGIRIVLGEGQAICDNTIIESQVWGVLGGFTNGALVENNRIERPGVNTSGQHGIYFGEGDDRYVIRRNTILDPRLICLHNNGSGGMNSGALIEQNVCRGGAAAKVNLDGVENSLIRNNVFYIGTHLGLVLFNQDGAFASRDNWIVGNTFYFEGSTGLFAVAVNDNATGNKIFNNILFRPPSSFRGPLAVSQSARSGFESNYNIFAGSGEVGTVNESSSFDGNVPVSLATWRQKGYDLNSIPVASPSDLFVDAANGNFTLKATAVAKGNGIPLEKEILGYDLAGTLRASTPSIGAYE